MVLIELADGVTLDEIAGIGPARKRALLSAFGTAKALSRAALADLEKVPGINAFVTTPQPLPGGSNFDIEFVVRIDFLDNTGTNAHDLQHARGSAAENDDREHNDHENRSLKSPDDIRSAL